MVKLGLVKTGAPATHSGLLAKKKLGFQGQKQWPPYLGQSPKFYPFYYSFPNLSRRFPSLALYGPLFYWLVKVIIGKIFWFVYAT